MVEFDSDGGLAAGTRQGVRCKPAHQVRVRQTKLVVCKHHHKAECSLPVGSAVHALAFPVTEPCIVAPKGLCPGDAAGPSTVVLCQVSAIKGGRGRVLARGAVAFHVP